jgi:hypothetical protein
MQNRNESSSVLRAEPHHWLLVRPLQMLGLCALIAVAACSSSAKRSAATSGAPSASATSTPQVAQAQATPSTAVSAAASVSPSTSTRPATPAAVPTTPRAPAAGTAAPGAGQPQALVVTESGFGQKDTYIIYAFMVSNPNSDVEFLDSHYDVAAYDASGAQIDQDSGAIYALFPGETLGIAGSLSGKVGQKAAKIEISTQPGTVQPSTDKNPLSVANVALQTSSSGQTAAAQVTNSSTTDQTLVPIAVIAYDAGGKIVGGGFGFLNRAPAGGGGSVKVDLTTSGQAAKVQMYAAYTPPD